MLVLLVEPIGAHGGMANFDVLFCRSLQAEGLDIIWATCDETEAEVSGCEVWLPFRGIYGQIAKWRRGLRYARGLFAVWWLACQEIRYRPVVIHQQFITSLPLEWLFAFFVHLAGIPIILTPHDIIPFYAGKFLQGLLPAYYRQFDAIVVHAQASLIELRQITDHNLPVQYIPHGSFNDIYSKQSLSPQLENRAQLGLPAMASMILFLGRIRPEKGLEYLIRAMPTVIQEIPEAQLLVAGQGEKEYMRVCETLLDELRLHRHIQLKWGYVRKGFFNIYRTSIFRCIVHNNYFKMT